jgi:predicted ATPase
MQRAHLATQKGYRMIKSIKVENFKCYRELSIDNFRKFNVIVGDSASGKTALLEAIFLALAGGPEITARYRLWRGYMQPIGGTTRDIEEAVWRDLFYGLDMKRAISIALEGSARDNRSVRIYRRASSLILPTKKGRQNKGSTSQLVVSGTGLTFEWTDSDGVKHPYSPKISSAGLELPGADEDLSGFFFFSSSVISSPQENATRFSALNKKKRSAFVDSIRSEFPWIQDITTESRAGIASLDVEVSGVDGSLPLGAVSSGINKLISVLLALASQAGFVTLIDEFENGVYFQRYQQYCQALLKFAYESDGQLFITTHSDQFLKALIAAGSEHIDDISLIRAERGDNGSTVSVLDGEQFRDTILYGGEVR